MKKEVNFLASLESYIRKIFGRSKVAKYWPGIGVGLVGVVMLTSAISAKNSAVEAKNMKEVVEKAARLGDYEKARFLYEKCKVTQCQSDTSSVNDLEDLVYPERVVEREIAKLEVANEKYPGNREIYLALAKLYLQIDNQEMADEYREKARILDPN